MTRLSAHIGYLYAELPLADRLAAAAADGFTAVEHPEPWAIPAAEMRTRLADLGLGFAQVTSGMGEAGEKGLAALPGRVDAFREGFMRTLDYAAAIGCPFVHPMAGVIGDGVDPAAARATYRENVAWALDRCTGTGVRLLVEAITIPGYAMGTLAEAAALQDAFGGRLSLLLDTFHATVLGLDPTAWATANAARIGHVHIADHPGRHEPGTGAVDFAGFLAALRGAGYGGAIGFEYVPSATTADSLGFLPDWKRRLDTPACSGAPS
jgi:hydroxypyruvate isomerase